MIESAELRSGKGHRDENFPVASFLIRRRHRPIILAFYNFVRAADDIADHPSLARDEKLARLDRLEATLLGKNSDEPEGVALRAALAGRGLSTQHAQDLLTAFRQDAVKSRYENWDELIGYCTYSAMPVGRFVLDVHGEAKSTWPASDAFCAALQIINHLQDCAVDYRRLNRVYLPLDDLARHGVGVEALAEAHASPALTACLREFTARVAVLVQESRVLPELVRDRRLGMEISAMQTLAARLIALLQRRDPLCEQVHLKKFEALRIGAGGVSAYWLRRAGRRASLLYRSQAHEY